MNVKLRCLSLMLASVALAAPNAIGQEVVLKDGSRLHGILQKYEKGLAYILLRDDSGKEKLTTVPESYVDKASTEEAQTQRPDHAEPQASESESPDAIVFVLSVLPEGAAAKAGLQAGDVLLAIDGQSPYLFFVPDEAGWLHPRRVYPEHGGEALGENPPIRFDIERAQHPMSIVVLAQLRDGIYDFGISRLGHRGNRKEDRQTQITYGGAAVRPALITEVTQDSPAARAGLQVGDVILAVDGKQVSWSDLYNERVFHDDRDSSLQVLRAGRTVQLTVRPLNLSGQFWIGVNAVRAPKGDVPKFVLAGPSPAGDPGDASGESIHADADSPGSDMTGMDETTTSSTEDTAGSQSKAKTMADYEKRLNELASSFSALGREYQNIMLQCSPVTYSETKQHSGVATGTKTGTETGVVATPNTAGAYVANYFETIQQNYQGTTHTSGTINRWTPACTSALRTNLANGGAIVGAYNREWNAYYREAKITSRVSTMIRRQLP